MDDPKVVRLTFGDSLSYGHLNDACHTVRWGGLCILPSDTCYSLAALPFLRDSLAHLAEILPEKLTDKIPLAFGSRSLVESYVTLTARDLKIIDTSCPGPVTLVCKIKETQDQRIIEDLLHTRGDIGIRIPDSGVERQISVELQRPITTCAIRDNNGQAIRSFDDAVSIVRDRMQARGTNFLLLAIKMTRLTYKELSTVLTTQPEALPNHAKEALVEPYSVYVYRPGAIEPRKLEAALRRITWSDIEDFT
jgi:L-threonylcarbamoyladenylate synthase